MFRNCVVVVVKPIDWANKSTGDEIKIRFKKQDSSEERNETQRAYACSLKKKHNRGIISIAAPKFQHSPLGLKEDRFFVGKEDESWQRKDRRFSFIPKDPKSTANGDCYTYCRALLV
jgi:hypothetical protein